MLTEADRDLIRRTAIRGRVALALTCVERALARYRIRDERIAELVEILWGFVEDGLVDTDDAWRHARAGDLLEAVDKGAELPESYRDLPAFMGRALDDTLWIGLGHMYGAVPGYGAESYRLTIAVLDLCQRNDVPLPPLANFARLPFVQDGRADHAFGPPVPRAFFAEPPA
jgi:hypothetical protein